LAGFPKRWAIIKALRQLAIEYFERPDAEVVEYIGAWISSGKTKTALCHELSLTLGYQPSTAVLNLAMETECGADALDARLSLARKRSAQDLVDDTIALADSAPVSPQDAQKVRNQIAARQWLAERRDRATFGPEKGASVHVTIGALHLDALRQPAPQLPSVIATVITEDAEMLTDGADVT